MNKLEHFMQYSMRLISGQKQEMKVFLYTLHVGTWKLVEGKHEANE